MHIKLYLPTKDKDGKAISNTKLSRQLGKIESKFCEEWGGFTRWDGVGGWQNSNGRIVKENVVVIETYTKNEGADSVAWTVASNTLSALNQDCVALVINNIVHYVR